MSNLYPGTGPSYVNGRTLTFLLLAVAFPSFLFAQPSIHSFSPASGPVGTAVTITGTNFNPTPSSNIVYFGAVKATVSAASTTALTVTVPPAASYQPVTVTTGGLTAYSGLPFITTFPDPGQFTANAFAQRSDKRTGNGPQSVFSADFDGDGKPDLVISNGDSNSISVLLNTGSVGSPSFGLQYYHVMNTGDYPAGTTAGDLDGDGKPDLVIVNNVTATIAVFLNTSTPGNISFSATPVYRSLGSNSLPSAAAIADLNGDGKPEIIVGGSGIDVVSVFANNSSPGNLSFSTNMDLPVPPSSYPSGIVVADFDGDGKPDLATEDLGTGFVSVLRNTSVINGAITFATSMEFPTGVNPIGLSAGDLDGDGKADLVTANYGDNTVSVLQNTSAVGALSFAPAISLPMNNTPYSTGIADLDGDGKPDLAITNVVDNNVSVFQNTSAPGNISMATAVNYPTGEFPISITIADLDGDGMPDLATADNTDNSYSILTNKGAQGPLITLFTPATGVAGTLVTITGSNLAGATAVSFGGTPGTITGVSPTSITATVGGGATGAVSVTTPSGIASLNGFTFGLTAPVIHSFSPTSGKTGDTITITGTGLSPVSTITFGGTAAIPFIVRSDSVISAIIGLGASGYVAAFSPYGADSLATFSFISAPPPPPPAVLDILSFSPSAGKTGDAITIKGKHLSGTTAVNFGGIPAQSFNIVSDSVITAYVGTGATGQLWATGASGTDSLPGFTYQAAPPPPVYQLNSFSPVSGTTGTKVTITGTHLTGALVVSFGGTQAASFTVASDTMIIAFVGAGASGQVKVASLSWQDSLAGFSFTPDTAQAPPPQPAPFQLLQFSAALSGGKPLLQWSARNEGNIAWYVVERSTDSTEFTILDSIKPAAKDAGTHSYTYTDPAPLAGNNYYRLKMVDTSTSFNYSSTIGVQLADKKVQMTIYPNPVKYGFTLAELPATGRPSRFQLTDMSGKIIKTQQVGENVPETRVDLSGVIRGTYKLIWSDGVSYSYQTILVL